jgi:hypothetical protein
LCWIMIGAGVYTIVPFIVLAWFNQPSSDDYTLAVRDRSTPLRSVLTSVYNNWSGRYLASVFSRLNPLLYDASWYNLYPIILISGFIISVFIALKELLKNDHSLLEVLALSSLFIHLIFSQSPSISEAFYWFSGSCIYQTSNIFTLVLLTVISRLRRPSTNKVAYTFLATLLCISIIGSNEVSMVIVCCIVFGLTVFDYRTNKKVSSSNLTLSAVCIACSMAVLLAPGNLLRMQEPAYYNKSPLWAFFGAASVSVWVLLKWATSLLAATLVYIVFRLRRTKSNPENKQSNFCIKSWTTYFVAVTIMLQLIIIYTAGGGSLGRVENNVFLLVIIGYFFNLHLFIDKHLQQKFSNPSFKKLLGLLAVLLFLVDIFNLNNNTSSAYLDIISGRAKKYKEELDERVTLLKSCKNDTCYVPSLSVISKTLFVTDIRPRSDSMFLWINSSYSNFYNAPFILPTGTSPAIESNEEIIKHLGKEIRKNLVAR